MESKSNGLDIVKTALIAFVLCGLSLWLQGNIDLNFADEGYLWYGAIRTAAGEIPVLDFQSYDPGRYYWAAAWSFLLGDGIMALRTSMAIFQAIALTLGLLAARRAVRSWWALTLVGLLLIAWMYPRHRLIDASMAMAAVFFAVRLIERPTLLRHFSSGVFVGAAAFFGRNHGLYGFLAFSILIPFIWFRLDRESLVKRHGLFWAGVAIGYSPMLFMLLLIPGYLDNFIYYRITALSRQGATNMPLPMPWPWRLDYSGMDLLSALLRFFVGFWFLLMPVFYLFAAIGSLLTGRDNIRTRALFIASTFVGVFYIHYAFSRADLEHLAIAIPPLLLGLVSVPASFGFRDSRRYLFPMAALIASMTFFSVALQSPFVFKNMLWKDGFVQYDIGGDKLWIDESSVYFIDSVRHIANVIGPDEGLLLAPYMPTMYCILEKRSPLREIYFLFPKPDLEQREMIRTLRAKNVNWAILGDVAVDGRNELRFRYTHNLVWRYFVEEFDVIPAGLPRGYVLLHKRKGPPPGLPKGA